jgi:hypothetical protein
LHVHLAGGDVAGLVDIVTWPLTKKLPSSASSSGPPSEPALAADIARSKAADKAAHDLVTFRPMLFMMTSHSF